MVRVLAAAVLVAAAAVALVALPARAQWTSTVGVVYMFRNGTNATVYGAASSFGPVLNDVVQGRLVPAQPRDGCAPWTLTGDDGDGIAPPANETLVALVERGNCSFEAKVWFAQQAGASFVLVFNNRTDGLFAMSASGLVDIGVSSAFLSFADGHFLLDAVAADRNATVLVGPSADESLWQLLSQQWVFVVFVAIVVVLVTSFLVLLILAVEVLRRRRRYLRRQPKPVAMEIVLNLPLVEITPEDLSDPDRNMTCAICLDDFTAGIKVRKLPCNHQFHQNCIDPWLTLHNRLCPTCKQDIGAQMTAVARPDLEGGEESGEVVELQVMAGSAAAAPAETPASPAAGAEAAAASESPAGGAPRGLFAASSVLLQPPAAPSVVIDMSGASAAVPKPDYAEDDDDVENGLLMSRTGSAARLVA